MDRESIDVATFLEEHAEPILLTATERLMRAHLAHYSASGREEGEKRLRVLLQLLAHCCRAHSLDEATQYAESLALERQISGYPLGEVQTAVNVLEEVVWRSITHDVPAQAQGYALGLVSTVLGAVKDRVACTYISEVSRLPRPTLRLDYLFGGTEGNPQGVGRQ